MSDHRPEQDDPDAATPPPVTGVPSPPRRSAPKPQPMQEPDPREDPRGPGPW